MVRSVGGEGFGGRVATSVRTWAAGRSAWVRLPLLLWMAWILAHYWGDPRYSTIFRGVDLAIHEIGHILWAPLGEFMGFAGGTLTQLMVPVAAAVGFARQRTGSRSPSRSAGSGSTASRSSSTRATR